MTTLHDEITQLRRALDEVERAMRPLRERRAAVRLTRRLDEDLRRISEDLDDLAGEAGPVEPGGARDFEPVPVPPRDPDAAYDPDCEDEGLAGWRSAPTTSASGRRS